MVNKKEYTLKTKAEPGTYHVSLVKFKEDGSQLIKSYKIPTEDALNRLSKSSQEKEDLMTCLLYSHGIYEQLK